MNIDAVSIIDNDMKEFDKQNIIEHQHGNTINIFNFYLHYT